jgi:hypothetical protein
MWNDINNYVDTSITQWEQYLLTKITGSQTPFRPPRRFGTFIYRMMVYLKVVIASWNSKTMISYMSSSNLYVPDSRWFVIQKKGATEQAMRSHITW